MRVDKAIVLILQVTIDNDTDLSSEDTEGIPIDQVQGTSGENSYTAVADIDKERKGFAPTL